MDPRGRIVEALEARPEIVFALLFGSRASGRVRPDSDWDIAVFLDETLDASSRFRVRRELAAALEPELTVDIVVLNDAPPLLAHRALMGQLLVDRDRTRYVRFFVRALGESQDEAYARRIHADARRERLIAGHHGRP
jgi:predicted nucleotidyltransferase